MNIPFLKKEDMPINDPENDPGLKKLVIFMIIGGAAILFIGFVQPKGSLSVIGLSFTVALAALFAGGFLGFLFGIPKVFQSSVSKPDNQGANASDGKGGVVSNTNLEQISDWLTKIIVGVSLTQLPQIEQRFSGMAHNISLGFLKYMGNFEFAYAFSCSLVIFYLISGFLLVYLWSRIYLLKQLDNLEKDMIGTVKALIGKTLKLKIETDEKKRQLKELELQKKRIQNIESNFPGLQDVLRTAQPGPATVLNDGQKNRWGGISNNGEFKLEANIPANPDNSNDYFTVTLTLSALAPDKIPLTGKVYFFLHNSIPNSIKVVEASNNQASISFTSVEAFTIGVICLDGKVKLELDLNSCSAPDDYKYKEKLPSEQELREEIEANEKELDKNGNND